MPLVAGKPTAAAAAGSQPNASLSSAHLLAALTGTPRAAGAAGAAEVAAAEAEAEEAEAEAEEGEEDAGEGAAEAAEAAGVAGAAGAATGEAAAAAAAAAAGQMEAPRFFTERECARLQGFPDSFELEGGTTQLQP